MTSVEDLYKHFGTLADAKDKAGEHTDAYMAIMGGIKGGSSEKRLASQFIARFFKYFPTLAVKSINCLFDLCIDADIMIRKQAIKDLPALCRTMPEHVAKVSEALVQLLLCDDSGELSLVQTSLVALFQVSAKDAVQGVFNQVLAEVDDQVREKALKFLSTKLHMLPEDTLDKEAEELFVSETKKVLQDVTKDEFMVLMSMMKGLKCMTTVIGRQQLIDIIVEQADLDAVFEPSDTDCVDRLMQCIKQATSLFSKNVHSKVFVEYICDHVIPVLSDIDSSDDGVNSQLEILKVLAVISEFCGELEEATLKTTKVYTKLLDYMPLPPTEENDEVVSSSEVPNFKFSYVECLLFTFFQLARRTPDFLSEENHPERVKDFRLRLQYFARGVQVYIKQLRSALQDKSTDDLKTDENKIKVMALKITSNINALIRDLFHKPPSFKAYVTLSWRPLVSKSSGAAAAKVGAGDASVEKPKRTPITFDSNGATPNKMSKKADQNYYAPPSGKFSERAGNYQTPGGNRGGGGGWRSGGGGGGYRGRNRGGRGYRRY